MGFHNDVHKITCAGFVESERKFVSSSGDTNSPVSLKVYPCKIQIINYMMKASLAVCEENYWPYVLCAATVDP